MILWWTISLRQLPTFVCLLKLKVNLYLQCIKQLFHKHALDMRWKKGNETSWAKLAIIISYPASVSEIIVLLKKPQNIDKSS